MNPQTGGQVTATQCCGTTPTPSGGATNCKCQPSAFTVCSFIPRGCGRKHHHSEPQKQWETASQSRKGEREAWAWVWEGSTQAPHPFVFQKDPRHASRTDSLHAKPHVELFPTPATPPSPPVPEKNTDWKVVCAFSPEVSLCHNWTWLCWTA